MLAIYLALATVACEIDEGGLQVVTGGTGGYKVDARADGGTPDVPISDDPPDAAAEEPDPIDGQTTADIADAGDDGTADDAWTPPDVVGVDIGPPVCQHCAAYAAPTALGLISPTLHELSGLAASRVHPGILYAHNDSGDTARFFALNQAAQISAELDLPGATNTDWEDIAMGPCPVGSCVYLSDTGDNDVNRKQYAIYRVAEPDTLPTAGGSINVTYEMFPFVYPDGPHNAESLLVDPQTGRVFIVLKEANVSAPVYELPLPLQANTVVTVVKVATLSLPASAGLVTGGSFHPCSDRILIRTKLALYELTRRADGDLVSVFSGAAMTMPVAAEPQGEAVEYRPDGLGYYTSSETANGITPALSAYACK
ncbi:MAG TPA: hypothetical protein VH374_07600 [Polyangia bacterium]|nr:hypothetical protein [Polyangia bacterium]